MGDICTDNRFELIEKYKKGLIESTNIETSQDEMRVLDNLLFRFWQMGWLDRLESPERKTGRWEMKPDPYGFFDDIPVCSECGCTTKMRETYNYCPSCGARMEI